MRRWVARSLFVALCAAIAAGLGTVTALVLAAPGRELLARLLSEESRRFVRGSLHIERITGDFLTHLTLDSVVLRDTSGVLLADVPRLEVQFRLHTLLARSFLFSGVRLVSPRIQLIKHRTTGRMNYEEIFRLGEGKAGGGASPLIELQNFRIEDGWLWIQTPWNPDGRLRTEPERDSALATERQKPGRRIEAGPEGLDRIRVIDQLTAGFDTVRISSPDRRPLRAVVDTLSARVSDPGVTVRDLKSTIVQGGDSLLFVVSRAVLPGTVAKGAGRLDWPRDTVLFHFALESPRVDLVDLRWISPNFPALKGRGRVRATSVSGVRTEYDIRNLHLAGDAGQVDGNLVAMTDVHRGLGMRNLAVTLTALDLETVRPYLDTLPFQGRLTGTLRANGFFDGMDVGLDWVFQDARVPDQPENRLALEGRVQLGGPQGFGFEDTQLLGSNLDLRSVRLVAPAVILDGRLALAGTLQGPWKNVVFSGRAEHRDGERPTSVLQGTVRLDTRGAVFATDADVTLDSLSFEGIRRSFPRLTALGSVRGKLGLHGDLERMRVDGNLTGLVGSYQLAGVTTMRPPRWAAESLQVEFRNADLAVLRATGPKSRLNGTLLVRGRVDSLVAPEGELRLRLRSSRIREAPFDSARIELAVRDSVVRLDTAVVAWEGGSASGAGTLGWAAPKQGSIRFRAFAASLAAFDSLAFALFAITPEAAAVEEGAALEGRLRASGVLEGALDSYRLTADAAADSVRWLDYQLHNAKVNLSWTASPTRRLDLTATVDSFRTKDFRLAELRGRFAGAPDDLTWSAGLRGGGAVPARIDAAGAWRRREGDRRLRVDSLDLSLLSRRWTLAAPAEVRMGDSVAAMDTVVLTPEDGSGRITLAGALPGRAPGRLNLTAFGVTLPDVYTLLQRDTTGVAGRIALDVRIGGTTRQPTLRGSGSVTGPVVGDFHAPLVRGVFNYENQKLEANLTFWRIGHPVLDVDAILPLDLAFRSVPRRQLPGPLEIWAHAGDADLAVLEAFTPNLRRVRGNLAVDAHVEGSWDAPRLGGFLELNKGSVRVPGLGVSYGPISGTVRLSGDSITADSVFIRSRSGELQVKGSVWLQGLTRPVLDLKLAANEFLLIDVENYLTLIGSGEVSLTGPVERPVLRGIARASNSVLYFSDLLTKDIVNLEDPIYADLVDTTLLRTQKLGSAFQSRFLDSLQIQNLDLIMDGVWLRSTEANIQLEGRVLVTKDRRSSRGSGYRLSGQLSTPRGNYTLKIGPVTRTFIVERGTLRYFNTPDLNADLDIQASHLVRTVEGSGEDFPVIAQITGTMLVPKLKLTTAAGRTPLDERDLVTLLVTGRTYSGFFSQNEQKAIDTGLAYILSALSSEVGRQVSPSSGMIEIRPPVAASGSAGSSTTQLAIGKQLGKRWFVTANAGACLTTGQLQINARNLGATLEYRFHRDLRLQMMAEPIQSCLSRAVNTFAPQNRYQFGADLKWDREY